MADKRTVQFDKVCSPYLSGEVAAFGPTEAGKLVSRGIAHYVTKHHGKWVASDEGGRISVNVKSDDKDRQVKEGAAKGAVEGYQGEGEGEGEGTNEDVGEESADEESVAAKPTRARRPRRRRAKL